MVTPQEIIRLVINKSVLPKQPKKRGKKGYGVVLITRLLVYSLLVGIFSNRGLRTHLEKHKNTIARVLGFKTIPHRTTIGRWKTRYSMLLFQVMNNISNMIQAIIPTSMEIVDSTPLEDPKDPDAKKGKTSKGWFVGFKVHIGINQLKIPLKAVLTTGNRHDSPILPELLVGCDYLLGDCGYDSKDNRRMVMKIGGIPLIDRNPRNSGKRHKRPKLLKKFRYLVEQVNSLLKIEVLKGYWTKVQGFMRKATLVYSAIIAIQVMAIDALFNETESLFRISSYRY